MKLTAVGRRLNQELHLSMMKSKISKDNKKSMIATKSTKMKRKSVWKVILTNRLPKRLSSNGKRKNGILKRSFDRMKYKRWNRVYVFFVYSQINFYNIEAFLC